MTSNILLKQGEDRMQVGTARTHSGHYLVNMYIPDIRVQTFPPLDIYGCESNSLDHKQDSIYHALLLGVSRELLGSSLLEHNVHFPFHKYNSDTSLLDGRTSDHLHTSCWHRYS